MYLTIFSHLNFSHGIFSIYVFKVFEMKNKNNIFYKCNPLLHLTYFLYFATVKIQRVKKLQVKNSKEKLFVAC